MSTEETAAYTWVAEHMPTEVAQALAQFVAINPRQRGIDWWTTLTVCSAVVLPTRRGPSTR